jgi:accessory colonization factor AcfC
MVVEGAGQVGMWEDVAGRTGDVRLVEGIRRNIAVVTANSGEARSRWSTDRSLDAWLVWTIWQKENPAAADLVPTEPQHTIHRSAGIATTRRTAQPGLAREFTQFLLSAEGQAIFVKWGWLPR